MPDRTSSAARGRARARSGQHGAPRRRDEPRKQLTLLRARPGLDRCVEVRLSLRAPRLEGLLREGDKLEQAVPRLLVRCRVLLLLLVGRRRPVGRGGARLLDPSEGRGLLHAGEVGIEALVVGVELAEEVVVRVIVLLVAVVVARAEVVDRRVGRSDVLCLVLGPRRDELVVDLRKRTSATAKMDSAQQLGRTSARLRLPRPTVAACAALLAFSTSCCCSTTLLQKSCRSCLSPSPSSPVASPSTATDGPAPSPSPLSRVQICACANVAAESDSFAAGSAVLASRSSMSASV